jgi:hypothetical protein
LGYDIIGVQNQQGALGMNNEEKILNILGQIQTDISGMQTDISGLKEGQAEISGIQGQMQADISVLKEDVAINRSRLARMEIEQGKKLQAIIDAQVGYEETHKQHEPRIVKLEKEADLLDTKVRSLQVAK